jgi:integrase/recombinase XerD
MTAKKIKRTPISQKAKKIAKLIRDERPDYHYMRALFQLVRKELDVVVLRKGKKLPYVPTEDELKSFYTTVWQSRNMQNVIIIKTLVYTGVRVSEFVNIKISDVDFEACQIRIHQGKGKKDRVVPFPSIFKEVLAIHADSMAKKGAVYLFESIRKKPYTDRGIRKILENYTKEAGLSQPISPHKLRHFLFTWLKKQGIDDALIQPYSGHESRQSLEIYSKLSITDAQSEYENVIKKFPI